MTRPRSRTAPQTRGPTPAPDLGRPLALLALAFALAACGTDPAAPPPVPTTRSDNASALADARDLRAAQARARVDRLLADPSPANLLATLAQGHAEARALLGPHNLRYKASFAVKPDVPARPLVDQPIQQDQHVVDELVLAWGSQPGEPVRLHLSQQTDKGEGREIIILDEQVYTRLAHRGWYARPLDSELHNLWLDEAQHCVHDLVEFAAPALAVTAEESGDALLLTLAHSDPADPSDSSIGYGRAWRQRADITAVTGTITLDRSTGLWRSAELTVSHTLLDSQGRLQRGETQLTASAAPAADVTITAPDSPSPAPERIRPETERQRLLGGLAGS